MIGKYIDPSVTMEGRERLKGELHTILNPFGLDRKEMLPIDGMATGHPVKRLHIETNHEVIHSDRRPRLPKMFEVVHTWSGFPSNRPRKAHQTV